MMERVLENYSRRIYGVDESVSSGIRKRINKFPSDFSSGKIVEWLESRGFRKLKGNPTLQTYRELLLLTDSIDDRVYSMGLFYPDEPGTQWIAFGTRQVVFFIRCDDYNSEIDRMRIHHPRDNKVGAQINDIDEFVSEVEKEFG